MVWNRLNPLRLPVHAPVVHIPVALLTLFWGMLILRYVTGDVRWDARGRLLHTIAVVSLPFAIVTAVIDTRGLGFLTRPRWDAALIWHALFGLLVIVVTTLHFFWRRRFAAEQLVGRLAVADIALASVAFWGLVTVGLLAGEMVFAT